jgi:cytochrome c556
MSSITYRAMGDAMKAGREAKSQSYPAAALAKWAKALPRMFPTGTGKGETTTNSQALAAIWRDRAGFDRAAANYADATVRLAALAAANDTTGFTRQLEEVDKRADRAMPAIRTAQKVHQSSDVLSRMGCYSGCKDKSHPSGRVVAYTSRRDRDPPRPAL